MTIDVRVIDHPVSRCWLTVLRDERTDNAAFRSALGRLAQTLVYEALREAPIDELDVASTACAGAASSI